MYTQYVMLHCLRCTSTMKIRTQEELQICQGISTKALTGTFLCRVKDQLQEEREKKERQICQCISTKALIGTFSCRVKDQLQEEREKKQTRRAMFKIMLSAQPSICDDLNINSNHLLYKREFIAKALLVWTH